MSSYYEVGQSGQYDEADCLLKLHDIAMSDKSVKATTSRMLQHLLPVLMRMLKDELKRDGSDPAENRKILLLASIETCRNLLNNMLINIVPAEIIAPQYPTIADDFAECMKRDGEEIVKRAKAGELNWS